MRKKSVVFMVSFCFLFACQKEEELVEGPAGPPGPTGPQGEKGENGSTGPQGGIGQVCPEGLIGPAGPQGDPGPSGWFKDLKLSKVAVNRILTRKRNNLIVIRKKALVILKDVVERRKVAVYEAVKNNYKNYNFDVKIKELLLAMLYLGEGFKKIVHVLD